MSLNVLIRENDRPALAKMLNELSPFEISELLANKKTEDQVLIFTVIDPELAGATLEYLPTRIQKKILKQLQPQTVINILTEMAPDDRTSLLEELPRTVVDKYIKLLPFTEQNVAISLLGYPEDTVGRLMTTDYIAVRPNWTVQKVLEHIRQYGHESNTIEFLYVVDVSNNLIDDIRLPEFFFAEPTSYVASLCDQKFIALSVEDKEEHAINIFRNYGRSALPVIGPAGTMLGVVTFDDIMRIAAEKSTENLQRVGGTEALEEPYLEIPFLELMSKRGRWLIILFIGELLTATAMGFFEEEIAKAVVLALFLPLIISSGGNAGSQSSTLIIRAMALGEVKLRDWWRVMKREISSGLFLGTLLGTIGFARVVIWSAFSNIYGEHWILVGLTIGLSLIGIVLWGSLSGAMLPIILKKLGTDPATSSAPLVATLVDVTGIIIYFYIAMTILKGSLL